MSERLNIILVDDDTSAHIRLTKYADAAKDISILATTDNSYHALELVKEYMPEAIVLDLELNRGTGNGLLLLRDLQNLSSLYKPYILITTNNSSTITYDCARKLGADFIMSKHQTDYSEKNVIELLMLMKDTIKNTIYSQNPDYKNSEPNVQKKKRLTQLINIELDLIGISPKAVGYKYLTDAILLVLNDQGHNLCTTIGEKYAKTNTSVERAMQNAINSAWRSNNVDELLKHYTARIHSEKGVPTLTELIYYYANKIKNRY
ncbi:MAG: response regulator [Lachnospiraceae bacterium]|nr:response regulator [Lachnospiraceae bacterium]